MTDPSVDNAEAASRGQGNASTWSWAGASICRTAVARRHGRGGSLVLRHEQRPKDDGPLVLQGNVDVRQVNLAFKVEGRIETLSASTKGDPVKPGQVLATLDKRYFDDELRLARARRDNHESGPRAARARLAPGGDRRGAGLARRAAGHPGERATGPRTTGGADADRAP